MYLLRNSFIFNSLKNYLLIIYLFCYIFGPAIINIYLTILAILSIFFIKGNQKYNLPLIIIIFFCFYILIKDFLFSSFNSDYFSFIRFVLIFFLLNKYKNQIFFESKIIYFLIFIMCIDTIFQYSFGYNILGFEKYSNDRLTSFFDDEPIIGSFLMKFFIIAVSYVFFFNKYNYINFSIILLLFISIFISGERMAFIQIFLSLFLICIFKLITNFKNVKKFILPLIVILSVFLYLVPKDRYLTTTKYEIDSILENGININANSISAYLMNFKSGIYLWKNSPFLGNGFRYYNANCKNFIADQSLRNGCSTHPHNILIETLSDHGIFGVLLLYCFSFSLLFSSRSKYLITNSKFSLLFFILIFPFFTSQSIYSSYYGSIFFLVVYLLYLDKIKNDD